MLQNIENMLKGLATPEELAALTVSLLSTPKVQAAIAKVPQAERDAIAAALTASDVKAS